MSEDLKARPKESPDDVSELLSYGHGMPCPSGRLGEPSAKYRHSRRSIRLKNYDYSQAGAYFITLCALRRACLFGEIVDGVMRSNALGSILAPCWEAIPAHFPQVELDEWVVMPNHFHGILVLSGTRTGVGFDAGTACRAPTKTVTHFSSPAPTKTVTHFLDRTPAREGFGQPVAGSIPTLIRSFKSTVTKRVNEWRQTPGAPVWHRNYYEHVVRTEEDLNRIRDYIQNNPLTWASDRLYGHSVPPPNESHQEES